MENSLLRRRLLHHIDCRLPSWLGSGVIVIEDCNRNLSVIRHVIRFGFGFVKLILCIDHHRNCPGNVGEIVDYHVDLILTLDNHVSFRSWHRNSVSHKALAMTTRGWQN